MKFEPLLKAAPLSGSRVKPFDGTRQYLSTGDLEDASLSFVEVTFKGKPSRADIAVSEGDVLFARMKGTKKVLRVTQELAGTIVSTGFAVLRPNENCDPAYLATYLSTTFFERQKDKYCSGAIQPAITNGGIEKLEIPLPPLDDQIRIAHLLGKVEGMIAQRKQHLQQLDDLLKSVFLEMFGDPVRNDKGWEKKPCSMVAKIITGHPFKSDLYTDDSTQLRLCGGLIIYPQRIEWDKCNYWPTELTHGLEKYLLRSNDIVLAMDRPWISSGLKICTIDTTGIGSLLVQRTACLRATDVDQYFLYAHLKDSSFTRHCKPTETTVPHISIKDIQTFQVLCPPRDLQNQFAAIGEKVESLKSRYQQSLSDLEALYGALSQKAFKGELDLSRVPLPDMSH